MQARRIAWAVLAVAMCVSATWLLVAGRDTTFVGDDLYYYLRFIPHGFYSVELGSGLEYFFAPHNGHLQAGGKLIYRLVFDTFGADYTVMRVINTAGVLLCVGLFYTLASRRVGWVAALVPSVLLLFYGYAWEPLLWAFDLHTVYALAFGLAALLALERDDRFGDVATAVLLTLSVFTIELGLAFAVGAAVLVLQRSDRWRRSWVFLVPIALYMIWWLWARQFDQSAIELRNIHLLPIDFTNALASIAGSVFGLNPTGEGINPAVTEITASGTAIAAIAVLGLAIRIKRGNVPPTLWAFAAVALVYWAMIALGGRPPDSSRYLLVGTVMVLLVAADALRGVKFSWLAIAGAFVVVALTIPPNIAKFYDGRRLQLNGSEASRTEYAMLELARKGVDPSYAPAASEEVVRLGGGVSPALTAADYFRASGEFGPLAYSLEEVRGKSLMFREVADATLAQAQHLALQDAQAPADLSACVDLAPPAGGFVFVPLPRTGLLFGSRSAQPVEIKVSRFANDGPGFSIGELAPHAWATLKAPVDTAPEHWRVLSGGPVWACASS